MPTPFMRFPEIYAVIDPDNTLEEVHENNNLSFNTFLLSCTTDCPIPDLSVTPASIRFDAETFTNSIVQIEVDVNTAEDVTDAVVSLFNGTLQQGTRIGDYTIGYIEEDSTGTALFTWDTTGLPAGNYTLSVDVRSEDGELVTSNNRTNTIITLIDVPTATPTDTNTPTPTDTGTPTNTPTATATDTDTPTATSTPTNTPTATAPELTATAGGATLTPTTAADDTPTATATDTDTPTATS
ncbi:MAG: hypothetical protein HC914_09265, partial [Chloroflexaceae bacterium]|nr:hypothetical protein [Chloroflexaceae bacterium]